MKKKVVIFMSILSIFAGLTGCGKSKEPVESNKESEVVSESSALATKIFQNLIRYFGKALLMTQPENGVTLLYRTM